MITQPPSQTFLPVTLATAIASALASRFGSLASPGRPRQDRTESRGVGALVAGKAPARRLEWGQGSCEAPFHSAWPVLFALAYYGAMETFYIRVGFTVERPVIPDQLFTNIAVATDKGVIDACLTAAQWVAWCSEMVTSTRVEYVEI